MTHFRHLAACFALPALFALAACGSSAQPGSETPADHPQAKSALARDTAPSLTAAEQKSVAEGNLALTADLVGALRTKPEAAGNLAFSPFSIGVAISMPYAGAKGATATEIAKAMRWTLPQDRVAKAYDAATLQLAERAAQGLAAATHKAQQDSSGSTPAPSADDFRLHVVNSVWADKRMQFQAPFLDTLAVDYGAGVTLADFVADADKERLAINAWVSDETQKKINDLLPLGAVDASTRLVLVNALHLKMPWAAPMYASSTPAPFHKADGTVVQTSFVGTSEHFDWYEDDAATAVRVPLEGGSVSMLFVLPKGELAAFEAQLDAAKLTTITTGMSSQQVDVDLPKFRFETASLKLRSVLESLGMSLPFTSAADFTGIGQTDGPLYVSDVVHKAMVGLDEHGVEAAAATAVVMNAGSAPGDPPKVFRADKPFFFAIVDEPSASVLFAGHVVDPTAK